MHAQATGEAGAELRDSWSRCWAGLSARGDGAALRDELLAAYAEPARKYHTLQHLRECIAWFGRAAGLAAHPAEVEMALWFHDAVYALPGHGDNEARSAQLAVQSLGAAGVAADAVSRVERMVLATKHDAPLEDADAGTLLLLDIDLSILGAPPARFAEYEAQIRAEYAFVPEEAFRDGRRGILRMFLARPRLYATGFFFDALEAQARRNLARAAAELDAADRQASSS